jgi:hypothetical protein
MIEFRFPETALQFLNFANKVFHNCKLIYDFDLLRFCNFTGRQNKQLKNSVRRATNLQFPAYNNFLRNQPICLSLREIAVSLERELLDAPQRRAHHLS